MRVIFTMNYSGTLLKMETKLENPVEYELPIGDELVFMNHLIGKYIIFNTRTYQSKTNKHFSNCPSDLASKNNDCCGIPSSVICVAELFINKYNNEYLFIRNMEFINWVIKYPWIKEMPKRFNKKNRYHFSSAAGIFKYKILKI